MMDNLASVLLHLISFLQWFNKRQILLLLRTYWYKKDSDSPSSLLACFCQNPAADLILKDLVVYLKAGGGKMWWLRRRRKKGVM